MPSTGGLYKHSVVGCDHGSVVNIVRVCVFGAQHLYIAMVCRCLILLEQLPRRCAASRAYDGSSSETTRIQHLKWRCYKAATLVHKVPPTQCYAQFTGAQPTTHAHNGGRSTANSLVQSFPDLATATACLSAHTPSPCALAGQKSCRSTP